MRLLSSAVTDRKKETWQIIAQFKSLSNNGQKQGFKYE